jgi:hypothetical protein
LAFWNGTEWVLDEPTPKPRRRHRLWGAAAEAGLITLLIFGLIASSAFAARGGGGKPNGGGTLTAVVLDGTDAVPNHTERLTFTVSTTATDRPFVTLHCWQGTTGVYNSSIGIFPTYMFDPWFTLDSSYWMAGVEASCTASLWYYDRRGNQKVLASTVVPVLP